jgi:hypothetical protein
MYNHASVDHGASPGRAHFFFFFFHFFFDTNERIFNCKIEIQSTPAEHLGLTFGVPSDRCPLNLDNLTLADCSNSY